VPNMNLFMKQVQRTSAKWNIFNFSHKAYYIRRSISRFVASFPIKIKFPHNWNLNYTSILVGPKK
jgi:hypothetical protein